MMTDTEVDWDVLAKFDSDLALRFAIQAEIDPAQIPDGHLVAWKSVRPDLRSGHDRTFRWPASGVVAVGVDDDSDNPCGPGLHLARTAAAARQSGVRLSTVLICAYRPEDVVSDSAGKVRVRRCVVLGIGDAQSADLTGANLGGAYLTGANLTRADLTRANLGGAYLSGADLTRAYLTRADLSGADLTRANLGGADLSGANLTRANLGGARHDKYTRWPDGFDMSRLETK